MYFALWLLQSAPRYKIHVIALKTDAYRTYAHSAENTRRTVLTTQPDCRWLVYFPSRHALCYDAAKFPRASLPHIKHRAEVKTFGALLPSPVLFDDVLRHIHVLSIQQKQKYSHFVQDKVVFLVSMTLYSPLLRRLGAGFISPRYVWLRPSDFTGAFALGSLFNDAVRI
jgi:hypothetical protein